TYKAIELLPSPGTFKRYRVLEWLNYVTTELHKGCSPLFNPKLPAEIKDQIFIPALKNKLNFLDQHLHKQPYLTVNEFALPDGYLFVMLFWLRYFNIELTSWTHLSQYFGLLTKRKSILESLKEEGLS